jgi:hypothetical protein
VRPHFGLVKARVAETLDPAELRAMAAQRYTIARASHFLGVHWSTVERAARAHRITFAPPAVGRASYGWHGVEKRVG